MIIVNKIPKNGDIRTKVVAFPGGKGTANMLKQAYACERTIIEIAKD